MLATAAGLVFHDPLVGWQRGERAGGEGIHDEVHPKHLRDGQGRLGADQRAQQDDEAGRHVDRQLEQQELLDIAIERAAPHDGAGDAAERVVDDGDVAGLLGDGGAIAHREAHLRRFQGGRVVGAIAGHGHDGALLLEQLHESLLVGRPRAAHDLQVEYPLECLLVGQGLEGGAGDDVAVGILVGIPGADLPGDLAGRTWRVARDDLDVDAGADTALDGGGHVLADRIGDGHDAEVGQVGIMQPAVGEEIRRLVLLQDLAGEAQRTHRLVLVGQQLALDDGACGLDADGLALHGDPLAVGQDNLGRSFHVEDPLAGQQAGADDRRHVFPFGGEGELADDRRVVAQGGVIGPLAVEPEQERRLGRVAQRLDLLFREVEERGRVDGDALLDQGAQLVVGQRLVLEVIEFSLVDLHLVLRQRTGLVGTDDGRGAHRLASVHLADQVVGLEHPVHAEGEAEGDAHRQSLGDGDDNQRDRYHEVVEQVRDDLHRRHGGNVSGKEQLGGQGDEGDGGDGIARLADHLGQPLQLDLQRRVDTALDLRALVDLSVAGGVAYFLDLHDTVAIHDAGAAHDDVGGISRLRIEIGLIGRLADDRLAGKGRLVDLQGDRLEQRTVGRHLLARFQDHDIADDHLFLGDLLDLAVADDLDHHVVVDRVEDIERLVGFHLEEEADAAGQHDREEDAHRLEERGRAFRFRPPAVNAGDDHGQQPRDKQDPDDGILKFLEELAPEGGLLGWCEDVLAVLPAALLDLLLG